jgi:histone H3/H4
VRDIAQELKGDLRFEKQALLAFQEAFEANTVNLLERGILCSFHGKRVTLKKDDLKLANACDTNPNKYEVIDLTQ